MAKFLPWQQMLTHDSAINSSGERWNNIREVMDEQSILLPGTQIDLSEGKELFEGNAILLKYIAAKLGCHREQRSGSLIKTR